MVPTDYRLDHVVARLIDRLEGTRRSYVGEPERALEEFGRVAEEHVESAIGELREIGLTDEPEHHARFLRKEVLGTFVPRYHRAATAMNETEQGGYGFGVLAQPAGRLALTAIAVVLLWFLLRLVAVPGVWVLMLVDLSLPFWPDIAGALHRRGYRRALLEIVEDMGRIQEQATYYARPEDLSMEPPGASVGPRARPETQEEIP